MNKITALAGAFSSALALAPLTGLAQGDLSYLLGVSVGLRDIEFDLDSESSPSFFLLNDGQGPVIPAGSPGSLTFDFDETLYTAGFSGTVIYDRIHLSALVELPIQTEDTGLETTLVPQPGIGIPLDYSDVRDSELDRIDFNLTLGYRVWEGLSVFTGYKYTEFDLESQEWNQILINKDQKYVEEGLFVGSSYNWRVRDWGSLSISVAYAYLDAEFSESNIDREPPPFGFSYDEFAYDGSANGLSYGIRWSGRLTDQWVYTLGAKYQSYESDNNSTSLQPYAGDYALSQNPDIPIPVQVTPISITDLDTEHTDVTFSVGLLYVFAR